MKLFRPLFAIVLLFGMIGGTGPGNATSEPNLRAVTTLNHLNASLARIIHDRSRVTLEREYDRIFNNINLSAIDDAEVMKAILGLADAIHAFRLNEREREHLQELQRKQTNAVLSESVANMDFRSSLHAVQLAVNAAKIAGAGAAVVAAGPTVLLVLAPVAMQAASVYGLLLTLHRLRKAFGTLRVMNWRICTGYGKNSYSRIGRYCNAMASMTNTA